MRMKNSLDKRTKWCYCIGATGRDAAYALVSMYLLTYVQYTMKLTVAQFGVISAAIVVCLIWDAINDALMGIIIENTHFKSGKFKPWIIVGAVSADELRAGPAVCPRHTLLPPAHHRLRCYR